LGANVHIVIDSIDFNGDTTNLYDFVTGGAGYEYPLSLALLSPLSPLLSLEKTHSQQKCIPSQTCCLLVLFFILWER
jgi:hypothetical protein